MRTFWRWLRYALAVLAALLVGGAAWIGWLLSGQRYQTLLTEQLSALFGARAQVERSHLSLQSGLGLKLDSISLRDEGSDVPFFVAESVDLLLDFAALWRGELLFHRIDFVRPRLQIELAGERLLRLVQRIRESREVGTSSESWFTREFTPTLAVQELRLHDGEITYTKTKKKGAALLLLMGTEASLVFSEEAVPILTVRTTLKNNNDDIGQMFLRATTDQEVDFATLRQNEWSGEIELSDMRLQRLGRVFAEHWPSLQFGVKGRFRGMGEGPVNFAGVLSASELQVGSVRLHDVELQMLKAHWGGFLADSWLRAFAIEAKIMRMEGQIGEEAAVLAVSKGELTLQGEDLSLTGLSGSYGKTSRFTDASVSLQAILAKDGPKIDARITADLALADDLPPLLTALTPASSEDLSQVLSQFRGRALARLQVRRAGAQSLPVYKGSVTFQGARAHLPPWKLDVKELNGVVQVDANELFSDALTFKIGESLLQVHGHVKDFLSSQRSGDVHLNLSAVRDYDLAPFLPPGEMIPQDGRVDGDVNIVFSSLQETPRLIGQLKLTRVRLDLLDFLQPFEVVAGELTLNGQGGSFIVERGQFPGGVFTGQGQVASWAPLRLELSGDFPDLDFGAALALDKPEDGQPKDTTRDVQALLTSKRVVYKDAQVKNLSLFCHWHDRQADLRIEHADVAGGKVHGNVVLWPDIDAAFLHPYLAQVDVERFFHAIGVSLNMLSGTLNGEGRIYMPQWDQWDELALWKASLSLAVENGVAQRFPILVRLWSVLSMQGLLRLQLPSLPIGGLPFTSLTGDFALGEGIAITKDLSLSGDSVRIDADGQIDLERRFLDLKTALIPLHGITRNVAKVPLAGKLLAQSADYLTTLNFRVSGSYDDPSVTPLLP